MMSIVGTKEAAEYLNVSDSHIIRLMEIGKLPFSEVGGHQYIKLSDLDVYQTQVKAVRKEALMFLVAQAQELKMGYS